MRSGTIVRIPLIKFFVVFGALILLGKLFFVQVIHGEEYTKRADRQYVAPASSSFDRGVIYFKEKDGNLVSAANLRSGFTLAIDPRGIDSPMEVYTSLSSVIDLDKDDFMRRAGKIDDPYEELLHRLTQDEADSIENLDIDSVILAREKWRYYPAGSTASQVLGFVGYRGDELGGRYGIERYQDDVLSRSNQKLYVNFFAEVFSNIKETLSTEYQSNRDGDIVMTIEPTVQSYLEGELKTLIEKWGGDAAGAIIMDPKTGDVYAMGSYPDFNPNEYRQVSDGARFSNPSVENVYEMGSIIKPLTMAAGLDSGAIEPESTYDDKGFMVLDGLRIANYDGRGRGVVPMQEILSQSLNTGVAHIVGEMGKDVFREYMFSFGMGQPTGIDLPNEVSGLVSNLNSTRDIEYATASFGQGIALTPIATIRALAVLANGGRVVTPHVVDEITYTVGFSHKKEYGEGVSVIKKETADEVTKMLVKVVDEALMHGEVKLDRYSVAAKTGTAQMASPEGGYYEDKYFHSFFGYFPAYNPRFIVFLYIKDPKDVRYASQTLTEPFIDITKFLLTYYEVPPDR